MNKYLIPLVLLACLSGCGKTEKADTANQTPSQDTTSESSDEGWADAAGSGAAQDATTEGDDATSRFNALSEQMILDMWQLFPSWAIQAGYYKVADQLAIPDDAQRAKTLAFAQDYKNKFAALDKEALDPQAKSDLALIQNFLDKIEWEQNAFKSFQWNPAAYNVSHGFSLIANNEFAPLDERLSIFSRRLEKVPEYYAAAKASLKQPASPQLLLAIQQNEGALSVFGEDIEKKLESSSLSQEDKETFKQRLESAREAIEDYVVHLQTIHSDLEKTQNYKDFRIGEKLYEEKFKYDIQIGMTAKELYERALRDKEVLHEEMSKLADKLWSKYFPDKEAPADRLEKISAVLEKLSENHATKETFKAEVEKQIPELVAFVKEKDLLTLDEDKPLVVRTTPPYMRGFSVASINAPGPYDTEANTYYNVMPIENYADDAAESFLKEYNSYLMQILNIHEAIPGHYTQLVYANKSPSLIKSILANGAMIEGWAVYTERMMLDAGYGDFSPELWLMYYKWNLRVLTNTILDYEIQVKGIDEDRAMELMVTDAFQQKAEAMGKWRRATLSQVQLTSYYAGFADIMALRKEMEEKLGDKFNLKEFHEKFLSYGNAPVPVIRELMLSEIAQ